MGRLVAYGIENGKGLSELTLGEFRRFYRGFGSDVYECLKVENAVNAKSSYGGTAEKMVLERLAEIGGGSNE